MTEPDLVGKGVPAASRRWILKIGSGLMGLLLVPEIAFAAKKIASKASKSTTNKARAKAAPARAKGSAKKAGTSSRTVRSGRKAGVRKTASRRSKSKGAKSVARASAKEADSLATADLGIRRAPSIISPNGLSPGSRSLSLHNVHTGEAVTVDYFVDGEYQPDCLREVDRVLRDYHTDQVCPIDPGVLDQLYAVRSALGSTGAYKVYSGYRSRATNEAYRRMGARVAEHSFHLTGQAIDVSLPGRDLRQVRAVALAMKSGGVGYYPWDGFVHIDSGPVRKW